MSSDMTRLSQQSLSAINQGLELPGYQRDQLKPGILHLGVGAFHRAHQCVYTDAVLNQHGGDWGIVGVSLRSATVAGQLNPQDGLFTVHSQSDTEEQTQLVGSLLRVLVATAQRDEVLGLIADESIRVITLTITEKGYCIAADGQTLDKALPDIQQDLINPQQPTTAIGLLAAGLRARYQSGGAALNIISCDNVSENSRRLQQVLVEFIEHSAPEILPWLHDSVRFPCSMVDRIVPAATAHMLAQQSQKIGLRDEAALVTEPFSQWIIERDFIGEMPPWNKVGASYVDNILPYEEIKLRLLNATHSAIAYIGLLAEKETVADVMADTVLGAFIERLMSRELVPVLEVPQGYDISAYREQLLQRFRNTHLRHQCAQIAMDGSQKIPLRWLQTLSTLAPDSDMLLKAMSAWCYFVLCTEQPIDDPKSESLLAQRHSSAGMSQGLSALLRCLGVTPENEQLHDQWCAVLATHCEHIAERGIYSLLSE